MEARERGFGRRGWGAESSDLGEGGIGSRTRGGWALKQSITVSERDTARTVSSMDLLYFPVNESRQTAE